MRPRWAARTRNVHDGVVRRYSRRDTAYSLTKQLLRLLALLRHLLVHLCHRLRQELDGTQYFTGDLVIVVHVD